MFPWVGYGIIVIGIILAIIEVVGMIRDRKFDKEYKEK